MKNYEIIPSGEVMARLLKKEEIYAVDFTVLLENLETGMNTGFYARLSGSAIRTIQNLIENEDVLFFKRREINESI